MFVPAKKSRTARLTLPWVILFLLSGCLPIPHTTPRSAEVSGTFLDAVTHAPVVGAAVYLNVPPQHITYTDAKGHFHMKATRNFHWAYVAFVGDWPDRKDWSMGVLHPDYVPYGFLTMMSGSYDVGILYLTPKH
jgi:hypothetical protein